MRKWQIRWVVVFVLSMVVASPAIAESGKRFGEGINVKGHWKIEVFNADGSRAGTTDFENSLDPGMGQGYLVMLLSGQAIHGNWGIELDATTGDKPCDNTGTPASCKIGEAGGNYGSVLLNSTNLNVDGNWSTVPRKITLSGSVTAQMISTIDQVKTTVGLCQNLTTTLTECKTTNNNIWLTFTSATLPSPPSVVEGQLIQVTVNISFN
jgi:hypothetical protein